MNITYEQLYDRCEGISAYEGGRIIDASGNSLFAVVHLTRQDMTLLKEYANQAASLIGQSLRYVITEISNTDTNITFTFRDDDSLRGGESTEMSKHIESVIISYIMWQWLENKDATRAKAWSDIYTNMLTTLPRIPNHKKPVLTL